MSSLGQKLLNMPHIGVRGVQPFLKHKLAVFVALEVRSLRKVGQFWSTGFSRFNSTLGKGLSILEYGGQPFLQPLSKRLISFGEPGVNCFRSTLDGMLKGGLCSI